MNTFTFSAISEYKAARDSGVIASLLNDSSQRSVSVTSFITGTGQSFIDAKNTFVDREFGAPGDLLVYDSTLAKYFWVKGGASGYGKTYLNKGHLSGVTQIGFMAYRDNNEARIISLGDLSTGVAWGSAEDVSGIGVASYGSIQRHDRYATWIASVSEYMAERYANANGGYYQYTYPLNRSYWNSVKRAFDTGAAVPAGSNGMSAAFNGGSVTITYAGTEGNVTIDPREFDWDFHKFYRKKIMALRGGHSYANADMAGARNTELLAARYTSYAAAIAHSYAISGISDFGATRWWLPSMGEWVKIGENAKALAEVGGLTLDTWYWTSTQCSASDAWYVNTYTGGANSYGKPTAGRVRGIAAFQIK